MEKWIPAAIAAITLACHAPIGEASSPTSAASCDWLGEGKGAASPLLVEKVISTQRLSGELGQYESGYRVAILPRAGLTAQGLALRAMCSTHKYREQGASSPHFHEDPLALPQVNTRV